MKISEIYDYLKLNGVKHLEIVGPMPAKRTIYVHDALIANPEQAWLNVEFDKEYFSTKPHDFKFTKKVTSSDLDRFVLSYHEWKRKLEENNRNERLQKLRDAIALHQKSSE